MLLESENQLTDWIQVERQENKFNLITFHTGGRGRFGFSTVIF